MTTTRSMVFGDHKSKQEKHDATENKASKNAYTVTIEHNKDVYELVDPTLDKILDYFNIVKKVDSGKFTVKDNSITFIY